jgi:uncharacterized membrane protein YraQ (UPF0718 family)
VPQAGSLLLIAIVVLALAAAAWARGGPELVGRGMSRGAGYLVEFGAVLVLSFLAAGLATALVPEAWMRAALGRESGLRGILIATGAGVLTPAGPFVAMPLAAVMLRSGAAAGPVVAFLTSWSLLALHRFVAWEIPLVGPGIATLRFTLSLAVPVALGLAARALVDR